MVDSGISGSAALVVCRAIRKLTYIMKVKAIAGSMASPMIVRMGIGDGVSLVNGGAIVFGCE
jgi:hypothetical protein